MREREYNCYKLIFSVAEITLGESQLSAAEKKMRFEMLVDRIVQFITNVEPSHIPTDQEIDLIESLVIVTLTGYSRGGPVIPWALCPSRPVSLKMFIVRALWKYSKNNQLPLIGIDGKSVRIMAQTFLVTDRDILANADLDLLTKVCGALGILHHSTTGNLSQTLEKFELIRETSLKNQKPSVERTVFKFESIVQLCIDSAMKITRDVSEHQNAERRNLMYQMRAYDESGLGTEWRALVDRMTHEGAPWHCKKSYPKYGFYSIII